jgi:dihydroorotate dehydrogenase (NAD+) catalytic subunit
VSAHCPISAAAEVVSCEQQAHNVFLLQLILTQQKPLREAPHPGQFYMLQAEPSAVLLGRPISLYRVSARAASTNASTSMRTGENASLNNMLSLEFLILKKGSGSAELCALAPKSRVHVLGPLGNGFPLPDETAHAARTTGTKKLLLVSGGIGVAPVAGFTAFLKDKTYDFYASFKSESYGLDYIKPANLVVTTEDGSQGIRGMLNAALDAQTLAKNNYSAVYACGPEPMLAYIQNICAQSSTPCFLSVENRMACGVGACLGCTVQTTEGNKRCCVDGPVFSGEKIIFNTHDAHTANSTQNSAQSDTQSAAPNMSVRIASLTLKNPVIAASGTFGYGKEYAELINIAQLGAVCTKGLTLEARSGNEGVRLHETASGLINSIGLENPGIPHFVAHELPGLRAQLLADGHNAATRIIANLSGSSVDAYVEGARLLAASDVDAVELNISCPNVKAGGMAFGLVPQDAAEVTAAVRRMLAKPLIVKLSPNAPDIVAVAHAVRKAGADALSMVNTFQAIAIDVEKARPVFNNVRAGLSGPAIKPLALKVVYDVALSFRALPESERIPLIALGGISTWQDAVEFIMAGACAIQVGTATFAHPHSMLDILCGITAFMERKGYASINDFCGAAL